MIDRLAPTQRPSGGAAGRQSWRQLTFLHWRIPAPVLRALVPGALELDAFDGECFVGVVPFTMHGVRPSWAPALPGISRFHETNVRTYVHRDGRDPGVWFFSLEAANRLAVWLARTFWHLPYHHAQMSLTVSDAELRYASARHAQAAICNVTCRPEGSPAPAAMGTLEYFLAERYILYTSHDGVLLQARVHHPPYPLQAAQILAYEETLLAASGILRPAGEPLAHYSAGVDVEVFALSRSA